VEARADIEEALRRNPSEATAHALRSIIALVQNQKKKALSLARKAAELEPQTPVPQVALSYAYQAIFDLEKALKGLEQAAKLAPEDALIHARLAELELSRGELERALKAVRRAVALDPELARTQTVLGFAYLTQIRIAQAKSAFERAITLDSADPLPRLGLGLVKIREGDLTEGTHDLEHAASLDPNNSLVRSYLGKAYYEQKRENLAATEYSNAKELDPMDPTPWFYDAILKQTTIRPVEALHDLQKAIELNDNRAVYRSRLLLDEDLAARSASMGRIYRDLGFEQLALVEGWKSVNTDPSDYSAHRLLADVYAALPRHEVARVSELLQSQLMQPINITPIQPRLAESNLFILEGGGPQALAFNEFNPLFARNRLALQASAIAGSNNTFGDEVTQSGIWGKLSYSLGQFHFETDGFRDNNDLTHDIYNVFIQGNASPKLGLQAEARHRETEHGDLEYNFDLNRFNPIFRRDVRTDSVRVGAQFEPTPHSTFIASAIYQDEREESQGLARQFFTEQGYIAEGQYLFRETRFGLVAGGGYYDVDIESSTSGETATRHSNGYFYAHVRYPYQATWTVGVSIDSLDDGRIGEFHHVNPKLGMMWDITPNTTLRLAAFRTLKRPLLTDQTIEPTQLAGFNQLFDDNGGTESKRFGIALDQKFSSSLYGGVEVSERKLAVPIAVGVSDVFLDWEEESYRTYLDWAPFTSLALSMEYQLEHFDNEDEFVPIPDTRTHIAPVTVRYFHPSGIFSSLTTTYVNQKVDFVSVAEIGDDEFILVDAGIGYRLPKRYGIVKLQVRNVFDNDFNYQALGFRTLEREALPFLPERTLLAQITLAF
jgi:tetratricopeptide (TPR) repeat protein